MNKKELVKIKDQKKKDKQKRKEVRKNNSGASKSFDDMIAYVDENGFITDTPPDPAKKTKVDQETIAVSTPKMEDIEEEPLKGRVDYFNHEKGFGFIIDSSNSSKKYFFHINNAPASITEGNIVTFDLERGPKGMNAVNISFI